MGTIEIPENDGAGQLAERFAPQLRFDQKAPDFPMSAQKYFDRSIDSVAHLKYSERPRTEETTLKEVDPHHPTYFRLFEVGPRKQVRIVYWWYYGHQPGEWYIGGQQAEHSGDWERVVVVLNEARSKVAAVVYFQHSGWYTRLVDGADVRLWLPGSEWGRGLELHEGTHPVVYVGKTQHGSYHNQGGSSPAIRYFDDWRNHKNERLRIDTQGNLVSLVGPDYAEPWMTEETPANDHAVGIGDGQTTVFDLDSKYVTALAAVRLDDEPAAGVQLKKGDGTTVDQIAFTEAPPDGVEITADYDRGGFRWGCGPCIPRSDDPEKLGGISTHPVRTSAVGAGFAGTHKIDSLPMCKGFTVGGLGTSGAFASQCEFHDRQGGYTSAHPGWGYHCPSGFTDMGAYCGKGLRTAKIERYSLERELSTSDEGLCKSRP